MVNLEESARDMLSDLILEDRTLDTTALEEKIHERAHEVADSECAYGHKCADIVAEYERHRAAPNESELGGTYRADQYDEARQAWAYEIACAVLSAEAFDALRDLNDKADQICEDVGKFDENEAPDPYDLTVSVDCPHGWAPHDREDDHDGTMYWIRRQLDGANALAIDAGPCWLSYTWTPEDDEDDDD